MTGLAIFAGIGLFLFAAAFFSKRRFGLLGLGLAAGYVLSGLWLSTAEFMVSVSGVVPSGVVSNFVATAILIVLPPLVLMMHGYSYSTLTGRLIGSSLFTVLGLAFLAEPITKAIILDGVGLQVLNWLSANSTLIIGIGVMAAVFDVFISPVGGSRGGRKNSKK